MSTRHQWPWWALTTSYITGYVAGIVTAIIVFDLTGALWL